MFDIVCDPVPAIGPPLVLLHGFLGAPRMWDDVVAALGDTSPIAVGWLPGHGPKPWFSSEPTMASAADAIAAALPYRQPVVLGGYSMGGRMALTIAMRHPDRVASVVAIGAHPGLRSTEEREARARGDNAKSEELLRSGLEAFVAAWEELPLLASQQTLPAPVRERQRAERRAHDPAGLAWAMRALGLGTMAPLWAALAASRAHIHCVAGALDGRYVALGRELSRTAPTCTSSVVAGAGHNVVLEAPAALVELVRGTLVHGTT